LRRKLRRRVQLANSDCWFFVQLYHWFPSILQVLTIIRPETLIRWHRSGFRCYWRWKRSLGGRPQIEAGLRALIRQMSMENPLSACGMAMTLRTGKSGRYRYCTCSTKARQGETGCKGRTVPMEKLDTLVADHIEHRLLQSSRLEKILSSVLDRREERTAERQTTHIAELRKRAAEVDATLKRLYDANENGVTDLSDLMLKDRIVELKAVRDQAHADAERSESALERIGPTITPQSIKAFARTARKRMRTESGGYRRD
jgi:hypothetical protein